MISEIKIKIEKEICGYLGFINKAYSLKNICPMMVSYIKEFICRSGKRVRPILFVLGYLGFSKKAASGLYRSAISIELLHDFMLVHDDIIDKSDTRRGKPSMHALLNGHLKKYNNIKFGGQDLTIVIGDVLYALGLKAFLAIKEDKTRKESALNILIEAALYTGAGEFVELLYGATDINKLQKCDIYKIYDYKTAFYTFAAPLAIGAVLAGAGRKEKNKLIRYGIMLGRAFQIKDDILGMFGEEHEIGKSALTDLQEAKKTILIWHAFNHCSAKDRAIIKELFSRNTASRKDLIRMRGIISESGALDFARKEVRDSAVQAQRLLGSCRMRPDIKTALKRYSEKILDL